MKMNKNDKTIKVKEEEAEVLRASGACKKEDKTFEELHSFDGDKVNPYIVNEVGQYNYWTEKEVREFMNEKGYGFEENPPETEKGWDKIVNTIVAEQTRKEQLEGTPVMEAIKEMEDYHVSTCGDKYVAAPIDTMSLIMNDNHGLSINLFNAFKYMSRYMTVGYEKSENRQDVMKAIHYLLFELARTEK